MRYLFGLMCVCALGVVPLVGCGDEGGPAPECWVAADCDHDNDCTKRHCTDGECHYTTHEYEGNSCGLGAGRCRGGTCVLEGVRNPLTGEECSAAHQADSRPAWFFAALVLFGVWRISRRDGNST